MLDDRDELDERCFEKEKEGFQSMSELEATEVDEDMMDEDKDGEDDEEDEHRDAEESALSSAATAADPYAGFSKPLRYPSGPLSRYQKFMRKGSEKLMYHYIKHFGDIIIER